jgi:hypothetical protein
VRRIIGELGRMAGPTTGSPCPPMLDDADVPILLAVSIACVFRLRPDVGELLLAAAVGVVVGTVGWAIRQWGRRVGVDARMVALLAMALLIGCRAPGQ